MNSYLPQHFRELITSLEGRFGNRYCKADAGRYWYRHRLQIKLLLNICILRNKAFTLQSLCKKHFRFID